MNYRNISEEQIARIKIINIATVATALGLRVRRNKCLCYNGHDKNSESLSLTPSKGLYHCFGCDEGGDVLDLVMNVLRINFKDACKWVSTEFNIDSGLYVGDRRNLKIRIQPFAAEIDEGSHKSNPEIYEWIIANATLSEKSRRYLIDTRGFSQELIESLKIRDIENPISFFKGISSVWGNKALLESGVASQKENGTVGCVWWGHVIIFPFFNLNGTIDYIQARRLDAGDPKYINLKSVRPSIFNLNSISHLPDKSKVLICEGIPDAMSASQHGYNAVAILGAHGFKSEWVKYFLEFEVYVVPDNDAAGRKFFEKLRRAFQNTGKSIREIILPEKVKDLNEFYNKSDK